MNTIQRSARGLSSASQRKMAQNTMAVNIEDIAYTSPSTAENQNESEKQYASAPTTPLPKMANILPSVNSCWLAAINFFPKRVMDQYIKSMVAALARADIQLTAAATN